MVPHSQRLSLPRRLRPWRVAAIPIVKRLDADIVHGQGIVAGGVIAADALDSRAGRDSEGQHAARYARRATRSRRRASSGNARRTRKLRRPVGRRHGRRPSGLAASISHAGLDRSSISTTSSTTSSSTSRDGPVDGGCSSVADSSDQGGRRSLGGLARRRPSASPKSTLRFVGWPAEASLADTDPVEPYDGGRPRRNSRRRLSARIGRRHPLSVRGLADRAGRGVGSGTPSSRPMPVDLLPSPRAGRESCCPTIPRARACGERRACT